MGKAWMQRIRDGGASLPSTLRKPAIARRWLAGARAAQVTALLLVAGMQLLLPTLLESALDDLYPPTVTERRILGILPRRIVQEDPRRERRETQLTALAWLAGACGVGLLLLVRLPGVVADAAAEARSREDEADCRLPGEPWQSLRLYRSALDLVIEPAHEQALRDKLQAAEQQVSSSAGAVEKTQLEHEATALLQGLPAGDPEWIGGRYRLKEELGRGGMGVVHRAVDEVLGREVALKELSHALASQTGLVARFQQEARVLARLTHPNIVQVYDLVADRGRLWIAMELIEGGNLADLLDARGMLKAPEALRLALEVARGLHFAHERGVIHRDVKPMNVLLTRDRAAKVTDFGLAKLVESSVHTREGALLGSPRYMSPEQAAGRPADGRSDIYAFGITLYEMLSGRVPFQGETSGVLAQQITRPPAPLGELVADLPVEVERLVMAMLKKDANGRPQHFGFVVEALEGLVAESYKA